ARQSCSDCGAMNRLSPRSVGQSYRFSLALLVLEQVENIGAYLRWVGVPTLVPVPINLPANTGERMSVLATPPANFGMGVAKTRIRAEVGGSDHATDWQL